MEKQRSVRIIVILLETLHFTSICMDSVYVYIGTHGTENQERMYKESG